MKPKDTIEYQSGAATQRYKGIVTWIDKEKKEAGVVILEPKEAQGGAEVIKLEEHTEIVVLEEFKPTTFRRDLSGLSVKELTSEIEELRSGRMSTKQVRHKQKRVDPQEALLLKKIQNLPPDIAAKLRKGLEQVTKDESNARRI